MSSKLKYLITATCLIFPTTTMFSQSITKENIENAEKIIGLDFTDTERDSMQSSLDDQLINYQNIHDIELLNSMPPAILFNPIPVGFKFPTEQKPLKFTDYSYAKF